MAALLCDEKVDRDFDLCHELIKALRGDIEKARTFLEEISKLENQ